MIKWSWGKTEILLTSIKAEIFLKELSTTPHTLQFSLEKKKKKKRQRNNCLSCCQEYKFCLLSVVKLLSRWFSQGLLPGQLGFQWFFRNVIAFFFLCRLCRVSSVLCFRKIHKVTNSFRSSWISSLLLV